eukprot:CAMPEP_0194367428 /NCGR_PEP_ID=MMETSP0174-20130528/15505_1 /TAXON_ID=216777 /ORGANISM="Proboscia alata, Strain PI-D3" /LENGTH=572 /DNA_ID=CAMNT_0039143165 /DNA_START=329 /DNA_END=2047 /DNA_ORIENTATION=+
MAGIYQNKNFGTGNENNDAVINMEGVSDLIIKNYMSDKPVVEFDGKGGFIGGSISNPVINVEISGIEIIGPNGSILWEQAMANRLAENKSYYGGRGIAIWKGNNINIHNMVVHHCPASAIRVNRGDYVTIHNNTVYSNTWWSRSAESAIVLAQSEHIDESNAFKMRLTHNFVYDNVNKIPYYNPTYVWNYSPIGGLNCGNYAECEEGLLSCPWQCRYGKATQNYIIDGSGVYVTRNEDTYLFGQMEVSYNTCHGNGINGVVFHRTNRGTVNQNIIYSNGIVPTLEPEEHVEDWHAGASGQPRQPYSGLVLNNAESMKLWSNKVAARYETDFAFQQVKDNSGSSPPLQAGGNNKVCNGLVSINPSTAVTAVHDLSVCGIVKASSSGFPSSSPTALPTHSPSSSPTTQPSYISMVPTLYPVMQPSSLEPSFERTPLTLELSLFISDIALQMKPNKKGTKWQPKITFKLKDEEKKQVGGATITLSWNTTFANGASKSGTVAKTTPSNSKKLGIAKIKLPAFKLTGKKATDLIDVGMISILADGYYYRSELNSLYDEHCPLFSFLCPVLTIALLSE